MMHEGAASGNAISAHFRHSCNDLEPSQDRRDFSMEYIVIISLPSGRCPASSSAGREAGCKMFPVASVIWQRATGGCQGYDLQFDLSPPYSGCVQVWLRVAAKTDALGAHRSQPAAATLRFVAIAFGAAPDGSLRGVGRLTLGRCG